MRERPILFSGPMVNAILAGQKTQTRRVINRVATLGPVTEFQPSTTPGYDWIMRNGRLLWNDIPHADLLERCPLGEVGHRLWVRESVWLPRAVSGRDLREGADTWPKCIYSASTDEIEIAWMRDFRWKQRQSIHMPRWACRILLEITDVRVQRLQQISEADACAEGVPSGGYSIVGDDDVMAQQIMRSCAFGREISAPVARFVLLWDSINGKRAPWSSDPWIWAITFKRIDA